MKKFFKTFLFFFITIFFLEYVYKVSVFHIWLSPNLIYILVFSSIYAIFLAIINSFLPEKIALPITLFFLILITLIFIGEAMFYHIYDTTFSVYSLNMANQAFDFRKILYSAMKEHCLSIICFTIPVIIYIIFHKRFKNHIEIKKLPKCLGMLIILYFISLISISFNKKGIYSPYNLYFNTHAPTITINKLGLLTEFRLDVNRCVFGFSPKLINDYEDDSLEEEEEELIEYNEIDLNFDNNSTNDEYLNEYFLNVQPTNKNDYTGIFSGKNLIYILAEGFNSIAVDEQLTPTLYKLVNSGLKFNNYYSPVFMSTTGGEFQFSTSLIPTQKSLNKWKEGSVTFPYAIGNVFKDLNYDTYAFHNWTYSYYKRQLTMPTLGFDNYIGCGNGLEKSMNCKMWPTSDISMISSTVDKFIDDEPFAVHYITVSGHAEYNFYGNNIATKNKKLVENTDYSVPAKAYLATQIELDRALQLLIEKLEETGKMNNTVIVLSGDHYPYTLSLDTINELSDYERDSIFEVNHSNLIIYNSEIETRNIDKLSSSVDVLPTILNMFGYEFDSRLLIGKDIMSEHDSLVIFADYSWISEKGRYNATTDTFMPNDGETYESDYVDKINNEIQNRVNVSTKIVEENYYPKILKN